MVKGPFASDIHGPDNSRVKGHPVDLFRERARPQKKGSNNYQLGSNIPCLHSHDIGPAEPRKPSTRVRDHGRDIMIKSNKCSWYQGMVDEAEMMERPKVRTHANYMTSPSVFPSDKTDTTPKAAEVQPSLKSDDVHSSNKLVENSRSPNKSPRRDYSPKLTPMESPLRNKDIGIAAAEAMLPDGSNDVHQLARSMSMCSDDVNEANLLLLKRLEEQQLELIKQHQELRLRIGRQAAAARDDTKTPKASGDTSDKSIPVESTPQAFPETTLSKELCKSSSEFSSTTLVIPNASLTRYDTASHRRLKGDVAQRCAQRDEGSIKNLIWYQEESDDNDGNNNKLGRMSSISSIPVDERNSRMSMNRISPPMRRSKTSCAIVAESSKTVQDLLANSFSSTF